MVSELARLRSENRYLKKENAQLKADNAQLRARLSEAEALIIKLTERLENLEYVISYRRKRRPRADDVEGEADDAHGAPAVGSKRSPGGQPGHRGTSRRRPTRIDEVVDHKPDMCPTCAVAIEDPKFDHDRVVVDIILPRTWKPCTGYGRDDAESAGGRSPGPLRAPSRTTGSA